MHKGGRTPKRGPSTNMAMAGLGRAPQAIVGLYADRNVVDVTGLRGAYDFKPEWVGRQAVDGGWAHDAGRA